MRWADMANHADPVGQPGAGPCHTHGRDDAPPNLRAERATRPTREHGKSVFLASIDHEIRTPISNMVGMTRPLTTPLTVQQREYLTLAKSSSQTLLRLIDGIWISPRTGPVACR